MGKAQAHVIFKGMVQGVNFRSFVQRTAITHNVGGWVRNLPDATVEAVFEGNRAAVEETIKKCRTGPAYANVQDAQIEWSPFEGNSGGEFHIKY
ncbi:MAG: acylphosphatase [Nitrospiraceae bacterium]|nr:acylphosphatase [Nitrospiraceae bacterium]